MEPMSQDESVDGTLEIFVVAPQHPGDFGGPEVVDNQEALGEQIASDDYINSGEAEVEHLSTGSTYNASDYTEFFTS